MTTMRSTRKTSQRRKQGASAAVNPAQLLLPRLSLSPKSKPGMVDARDPYVTGALSTEWGISHDHICRAASELGRNATTEAVHKRALELRAGEEKVKEEGARRKEEG